jgi:hypothetical protein
MVKDSLSDASTGGWGFARFDKSKCVDEVIHGACFACHVRAVRDFVFTRYA